MITFITILLMIITMLISPIQATENKVVVSEEKIACKDGYQYYIEYSDGSIDEYFVCDTRAAEELMEELNNAN